MGCVVSSTLVSGITSSSSTIALRKGNSDNSFHEGAEDAIGVSPSDRSEGGTSLRRRATVTEGNNLEILTATGKVDWTGTRKEMVVPEIEETLQLPSPSGRLKIRQTVYDLKDVYFSNPLTPLVAVCPGSPGIVVGSESQRFLPQLIGSPTSGYSVSPTQRRLGESIHYSKCLESSYIASASADFPIMHTPQLQQVLQQSLMSFCRSEHRRTTPESLSDISDATSIVSTPAHTIHSSNSVSRSRFSGSSCSFSSGVLKKDEELEAPQPLSSERNEADLFVYDDIVISKNEARTKHWRLAGRKPPSTSTELTGDSEASGKCGFAERLNSAGKRFFSFNDFDVCVDEMDIMSMSGIAAGQATTPWREAAPSGPTEKLLRSFTVTSAVATTPNTVAHFLDNIRLTEPKANRPLRGFTTVPYLGHATRVKCLALAPSETDFVSCSNEDASVTLQSAPLNSEVGIFTGHQDTVINATFSPDGKYLATASKDKTMILWDVMTTKRLLTFAHPKVVICCCFSPDSKYVVSGCQDRVCRLWDTRRGREWLCYTGHKGIIIAMAYSPNGNYLCSASADKSLCVWSTATAKTVFHLTGHVGIILSCSYTSDGEYIISNDESILRVWSAKDGSCKLSISPLDIVGPTRSHPHHPRLGWTLSSAAPGSFTQLVVVACNNRFVYLLDMNTGREVASIFCKAPVYCLTVGSYEKVVCGDSFGNIYILNLL